MRRYISFGVLTVCGLAFLVPKGYAQLVCRSYWTAEYKCLEHCGPCPTPAIDWQRQQQANQLELARQRELQHLQEEAERKQKAADADQAGVEAANRGNWSEAADHFIQALGFAPESTEIREHLNHAKSELADIGTAEAIAALQQRVEDAIAASAIEAIAERREDDEIARQLEMMAASFHSRWGTDTSVVDLRGLGNGPLYPVLLRPVPPNSPPAKVLAQSQPKIKSVDQKILEAQNALRRLIQSNSKNQELREEWVKESNEATVDAQDLSLSLLIDLIGAHVDHLAETNKEERGVVLQHLLNRAEENGRQNSIHSAYGALVNRKVELERIQGELRLAGKADDLRIKIRDFDMEKGKKPTWEDAWDVINAFDKVEEMAGPTKDLMDAAYTIYRQAASCRTLSMIRDNDEKNLQAAASLQHYIQRLQAKKKAEAAEVSR
jgi:hypothetical protein